MSMTRWVKIASILLVAGATASGIGLNSRRAVSGVEPPTQKKAQAKAASDMPVAEVKNGTFKLSVSGPGSIEPGRRMDMLCQVEGSTTIISIMPEGTRVKKGDVVCELDSASLRDRLTNQKIASQGAEASYRNARLARENAEFAVKEYQEGTYLLDRSTILGQVKLAESALQKARARLDRIRRARQRLNDTPSRKEEATSASHILAELDLENQLDSTEQTLMREQASLENAQGQRNLLEKYTKDRTIRELGVKVDERRSVELAKEQNLRARAGQGSQAREADRQLQALRPWRRRCRLCQRPEPVVRQRRPPDRGRRDGPRAAAHPLPLRHQRPDAGERQDARVDGRS